MKYLLVLFLLFATPVHASALYKTVEDGVACKTGEVLYGILGPGYNKEEAIVKLDTAIKNQQCLFIKPDIIVSLIDFYQDIYFVEAIHFDTKFWIHKRHLQ